jgi:hypothetical protein
MTNEKNNNKKLALLSSLAAIMLLGLVIVGLSTITVVTTTPQVAYATSEGQGTPREDPGQPDDPDCWGEANSDLARDDFGDPGVGSHASDPVPGDDDRETPRDGVGNQAEDTPPEHGAVVGPGFGQPCEEGENDP